MKRRIINIDRKKCNGCGACAKACHEGAIGMVEGKAQLLRDDYCDGLGDCLPTCPTGAITFVEREAAAYDEKAVLEAKKKNAAKPHFTCPGTRMKTIEHDTSETAHQPAKSRLSQWPVQIKLLPVNAPFFDGADLLIAADCTAYAYGDFHDKFIKNRVTLIGCPKLDSVDYSEKLTKIFRLNRVRTVTIVRMEVPCCIGLENAVKTAITESGRVIPLRAVVVGTDGEIR